MKAIKGFFANPANVRKSIGAFVSSALLLVASHQLPDVVGLWVAGFQPLFVAYGVWKLPNTLAEAPVAPSAGV